MPCSHKKAVSLYADVGYSSSHSGISEAQRAQTPRYNYVQTVCMHVHWKYMWDSSQEWWWHMPVTQALWKLKQGGGEFETSLDYTVKLSFNIEWGGEGERENCFPWRASRRPHAGWKFTFHSIPLCTTKCFTRCTHYSSSLDALLKEKRMAK